MSALGLRFCARAFSSCGKHSSSRCAGLSLLRPLLLRSTGSRCTGSVVVAHGPSCSAACGIFPDQGSNPCPLHWQADSQPLYHQGRPEIVFLLDCEVLGAQGMCGKDRRGRGREQADCLLINDSAKNLHSRDTVCGLVTDCFSSFLPGWKEQWEF